MFIKVYINIVNFKNFLSFLIWFYRIVYNVFYDYICSWKEIIDLDVCEVDVVNSIE